MTQAIAERTEEEKMRLAQETVDYLNELMALDEHAISWLMRQYIECNIPLTEHPTVQVNQLQSAHSECVVGLIGIINGLIGARDGIGYMVANYSDETAKLIGFSVVTEEQRKQLKGLQ